MLSLRVSYKIKTSSFCNFDSAKTILLRKEFYLLWLTRFGMVLISQCLSGFYKAFALKELSYNDEFIATVGAVAGIFNCIGRISMGFLVDKFSYRQVFLITQLRSYTQ